MTSQSQRIVVEEDLPRIRATLPMLADLSDRELEELYCAFSYQTACAGWLAGSDPEGFRCWALLSPVQRVRAAKSDEDSPHVCICLASGDWATIHGSLHTLGKMCRDFAEKTPADRSRALAMADDHRRLQSEMLAQQHPTSFPAGLFAQPKRDLIVRALAEKHKPARAAESPAAAPNSRRGVRSTSLPIEQAGPGQASTYQRLQAAFDFIFPATEELLDLEQTLPNGPERGRVAALADQAKRLLNALRPVVQEALHMNECPKSGSPENHA